MRDVGMNEGMERRQNTRNMQNVFAVTERPPGKSRWTKVGVAFTNRDGSLTLRLDAVPVSGKLQVRERDSNERGHLGVRAGG